MKKAIAVTRVSAKQKLDAYKGAAFIYISKLRTPGTQSAFSVKGYEVTPTGKKPNALSAPELLAIVNTARKLGKIVQLTTSGISDGGQLDFQFVDAPADIPSDLY
jgi:hypothetical protein